MKNSKASSYIQMRGKPHKSLNVWKESIELISKVYKITNNFPRCELYGLSSQIQRAAISIASNISEGAARQTKKEFIKFLYIAQASLSELDTQFEVAKKLRYISEDLVEDLYSNIQEIDKMLTGLIRSLKNNKLS